MERILQSFKDLYKCENVVKRHLWYAVLMILPGMLGAMRYIVDKDTPKDVLLIGLIAMAIIALLAIVPTLFSFGLYIDFFKDRLEGKTGIPQLKGETLITGLKYFPLSFVWGLYFGLIFIVLFFIPMFGLIGYFTSTKSPDPATIIFSILFIILFFILAMVIFLVVGPFFNYITAKYAKLGYYTADMFNPFTLFGYMKKAFKSTMLVMLKMLLASFLVNIIASCVTGVLTLLIIAITAFAIMTTGGENADKAMYSAGVILTVIPIATLCGVIQAYATGMVGFAAADNYVEVYKEEIEPCEE